MKGPDAINEHLPTGDGGFQKYKAAGKLEGKKAIITGGDSGIGRAVAILYAMEGADSLIAYLEVEEKDAQETKKKVEAYGRKCHLIQVDLKKKEDCKKVVDFALEKMGAINILVNNAAYQNMVEDIKDLTEEQWEFTFATNIHFFYMAKYALPHMHPGDSIINNASINAYIGRPDLLVRKISLSLSKPSLPLGRLSYQHSRIIFANNLPGLHINKGRHHLLHPWSPQPIRRPRHPR
jgi:NAD(P)-dependent dehydrogenase (short-subunit alcohol dehydrogenase family)